MLQALETVVEEEAESKTLNSWVVSASVGKRSIHGLKAPVKLTLPHSISVSMFTATE